MDSQGKLSDQMRRQGSQAYSMGMPQVQSTIDYYRTLMDGSRAARMNAVSGETQDVAQAYSGADAAADRNLQGGEREQAKAENARMKAGQISRLVTGVRPGAAAALGSMGTNLVGAAGQFQGSAADITGSLLGNETANRQGAFQAGENAANTTSENMGKLFGSLAGAAGSWGGGGGGYKPKAQATGSSIVGFNGMKRGGPELSY